MDRVKDKYLLSKKTKLQIHLKIVQNLYDLGFSENEILKLLYFTYKTYKRYRKAVKNGEVK